MKLHLPRRRILRALIYLVSLVLIAIALDMMLVEHWRTIHPGYQTTRILSPTTANGIIDYQAAVEANFGRGATPENNAAIPILQALGRNALPPSQPRDGITERLGMPPLPDHGDYFVSYADYTHDHPSEEDIDPADPDLVWPVTIKPATVAWIQANEKPLARLTDASKRSRYFMPFNGGNRPQVMLSVLLPHVKPLRDVRRALLTRSLIRLNAGDVDGCLDDIRTSHRLARLLAQDWTLVGRVVAFEQEDATCRVQRLAAMSGKLSSAQLRAQQSALASMSDLWPVDDAINRAERYIVLDTMQVLATASPEERANLFRGVFAGNTPDWAFRFFPVHYDKCMEVLNSCYDGALAATESDTYADRIAALRLWEKHLQEMNDHLPVIRMLSSDWPATLFVPGLVRIHTRADGTRMQDRLTLVALALATYKSEKGEYPAALAQLQPDFIPLVPLDVFSTAPLKYSRTPAGYTVYSVGPNIIDDGGKKSGKLDDVVVNGR
jgi:hypothetical protein